MIYLLFILSLATVAYSQTCSDGGQGPCVGGSCSPGFTCIQDGSPDGLCCSDTNVVTTTTTVSSTTMTTTVAGQTTTTVPGQTTTTVPGQTTTTIPGQTTTTVAGQTTTTGSGTCVDKLNPKTGVSDCPSRANLCNDSEYYSLMTDQCPKTCGRCGASGTTTAGSTCVDKVNPNTGVSDCPSRANLCNDSQYYSLMTDQPNQRGMAQVETAQWSALRQDPNQVPRTAWNLELDGTRPCGRPKTRYIDTVKKDMEDAGLRKRDARDRKKWRDRTHIADPST